MTSAGVKMQELEETKRHNRASLNEHLGSTLGGSAIGALGRVAGAAIKAKQDSEWYKRVMSLFETSTNLPFARKKGRPFTTSCTPQAVVAYHEWVPTIGTVPGSRINTPVMIAFKDLFATIRGRNSGSVNYDAVDLGIVELAIDSVLTNIYQALRALRVANRTTELNPVTRAKIVENMGYDMNELTTFKDQWLNMLNKAIEDLNSIRLPGGLSYFERHKFLSSYIFCEKDRTAEHYYRSNFHVFKTEGYFVYDELNGELDYQRYPAGSLSLANLRSYLNTQLVPLINSDAVSIMSGDIDNAVIKGAISEAALIKLEPLTDDDIMGENANPYVYNKDILNQIANAQYTGNPYGGQWATEFSIHQDVYTGVPYVYQGTQSSNLPVGLRFNNDFVGPQWANITQDDLFGKYPIFKTTHDQPDCDEVIESSRFMYMSDYSDHTGDLSNASLWKLYEHGSEILIKSRVYYYGSESNFNSDVTSYITITKFNLYGNAGQFCAIERLIRGFKYFPMCTSCYTDPNSDVWTLSNYQTYNYRIMSRDEMRALHECAIRSQLAFNFTKSTEVNKSTNAKSGQEGNSTKSKKSRWNKNKKKKGNGKKDNVKDKDKPNPKDGKDTK